VVADSWLKIPRQASSTTIRSADVHASGPGAEVEADRRELSLAITLSMNGLRFNVDEVARRGVDGPVPGGTRVDVDRAGQDVSDNVMVSVMMPGSSANGRLTSLHRDGESLTLDGRTVVRDLRLRYVHDAHGRLLSSSRVQASGAAWHLRQRTSIKSSCGNQVAGVISTGSATAVSHAFVTKRHPGSYHARRMTESLVGCPL
jgi:hypothetical protein